MVLLMDNDEQMHDTPEPDMSPEAILASVPYRQEVLAIRDIGVDRAYQRSLVRAKVTWLSGNWDPRVAHVLRVNQRDDGTYWVMDGQHRLRGAEGAGFTHVLCHVYRVPREEEATLFHLWNTHSTKAQPKDVFRARLVAGDAKAFAIKQLIESTGYVLDLGNVKSEAADRIACVRTLEMLYDDHQPFTGADYDGTTRRGRRRTMKGPNPERLRLALIHLRNTWPDSPGATHETMVRAMDRIVSKYGFEIDWKSFYLKCGALEPRLLGRRAAEQSKLYHQASETLVANELIRVYNQGKRSKRLRMPGGDDEE